MARVWHAFPARDVTIDGAALLGHPSAPQGYPLPCGGPSCRDHDYIAVWGLRLRCVWDLGLEVGR